MKLSARAERLQPSATLTITAKAKELRAAGIDVIGFGAGEPDFDTPDHVKDFAIDAIHKGHTKYTVVSGIDELKESIKQRIQEDHGLTYENSEITVSCGAKHSLYNIAQVLFDKGDEVLIPSPYWVSYPEQVRLADATPIILDTDEQSGFKITPDTLGAAITPNTKALILNYPSNPTGATYLRDELLELATIAVENNLVIISDEIYEKILYDGLIHTSVASLGDEIKRSTLLVNGVSKTYAMTGWRIGYIAGDKDVVAAVNKLQGQSTSNPASISQWAAYEAFSGPHDVITEHTKEFEKRRDYIVGRLRGMEGMECFNPHGAFYVFPDISGYFGKSYGGKELSDSLDFTEFLLEEARVAVVPGVAFGSDKHVRISYATSMEDIVEGMDRIESALAKLA